MLKETSSEACDDRFKQCLQNDGMIQGKRIREARERRGLSQEDVAAHFDISGSSVSQWEAGTTQPAYARAKKLARFLGVTLSWLEGEENEESPGTIDRYADAAGRIAFALEEMNDELKLKLTPGDRAELTPRLIMWLLSLEKSTGKRLSPEEIKEDIANKMRPEFVKLLLAVLCGKYNTNDAND